ncbi:hypothetical protein ACJMK2_043356 [Sinanodonta woodiana]|uniref:Chitin-binding type-4 domain-containing protein n=1 Tax=Sinanodonta woodiana TaxID=1069815 RepID=A0ABD3VWN4_SINWO
MVVNLIFIIVYLVPMVTGHGRMIEPAMRSSMWRFGYNTPVNYNDMGLNCGGFVNHFETHGGKCGVCGDPWEGPRENEAGGKYALGVVARQYKIGQVINVTIELTSNHMGYFEFRLCPVNDPLKTATQACLDRNRLNIIGYGTRYHITTNDSKAIIYLDVLLPPLLKCKQCVLQWKWVAAQSMGPDGKGGECLGCGKQEHFINCADIAIGRNVVKPLITTAPQTTTSKTTTVTTPRPPTSHAAPPNYADTQDVAYNQRQHTYSNGHATTTMSWNNANQNAQHQELTPGWHPSTRSWRSWNGMQTTPSSWNAGGSESMMYIMPSVMENLEWGNTETVQNEHGNPSHEPGEYGEYPLLEMANRGNIRVPTYTQQNQRAGHMKGIKDPLRLAGFEGVALSTFGETTSNGVWQGDSALKISASNLKNTDSAHKVPLARNPTSKACADGITKPVCKGIGLWKNKTNFDKWCTNVCPTGDCPKGLCECNCPGEINRSGRVCRGLNKPSMDKWCTTNCEYNNCPPDLCICE